jgi:hypothetical protein
MAKKQSRGWALALSIALAALLAAPAQALAAKGSQESKGATLNCYSYLDGDGSGSYSNGERLFEKGVVYTLYRYTQSGYVKVTQSASSQGVAYFYNVASGSYAIKATNAMGYSASGGSTIYASVSSSYSVSYSWSSSFSQASRPYFGFYGQGASSSASSQQGYSIPVYSYIDANGDGSYSSGESMKGGFSFTVYRMEASGRFTSWQTVSTSRESGKASVGSAGPGRYLVRPNSASGYQATGYSAGIYVSISASGQIAYSSSPNGQRAPRPIFGYAPSQSLTVGGWYDDNADGLFGSGEGMWGSGRYALYGYAGGSFSELISTVSSSSNGQASFGSVPSGRYRVMALGQSGFSFTSSSYINVTVSQTGVFYYSPSGSQLSRAYFGYCKKR